MPCPTASGPSPPLDVPFGRPPLAPFVEARKAARLSLRERCQQNELEFVETLEHIARHSLNDNARISAISQLFDRGRGKAAQPHDGDGQGGAVTLMVYTSTGA